MQTFEIDIIMSLIIESQTFNFIELSSSFICKSNKNVTKRKVLLIKLLRYEI